MGCFAEFGWAWNVKPSCSEVGWKASIPSAEFTESLVIFLYGCSNVFLEHLGNSGGPWFGKPALPSFQRRSLTSPVRHAC
jgi:hypothetical protein